MNNNKLNKLYLLKKLRKKKKINKNKRQRKKEDMNFGWDHTSYSQKKCTKIYTGNTSNPNKLRSKTVQQWQFSTIARCLKSLTILCHIHLGVALTDGMPKVTISFFFLSFFSSLLALMDLSHFFSAWIHTLNERYKNDKNAVHIECLSSSTYICVLPYIHEL